MIIAIDPGGTKLHALAFYSYEILDIVTKSDNIQLISKDIKYVDKVFIETQYNGGSHALVNLIQRTGMLMGLCELHGTPYEMVMSSVWQNWHKIPKKPKEIKRYAWGKLHKQHLIEKAEELTGYDVKDDDEASAILLGYWAIHREQEQEN